MFKFISICVATASSVFAIDDEPYLEEPPLLTVNSFDELVLDRETNTVKGDKAWFIKFFAPWCGHCKRLAPTWSEFHSLHNDKINVARIDCTDQEARPLCEQFGIRGYPSLLLLDGDQVYKYKKQRNLASLEEYAIKGDYKIQDDDEDTTEIPKRLEGMQKFQKDMGEFLKEIGFGIDQMFNKLKLGFVPRAVRYTLILALVFSPLIALIALCL